MLLNKNKSDELPISAIAATQYTPVKESIYS